MNDEHAQDGSRIVGTRRIEHVNIALLCFDGCPHAQAAETNLWAALANIDSGDAGGVLVRK